MKAAVIHAAGQTPRYEDFADPVAADGETLVTVAAAAITNIARMRAAGTHYSAHQAFPAVVGVDCVGRTADGGRVYCGGPREPYGTCAELVPVTSRWLAPVPDALDDATAAALVNPGVSAWLSLAYRAGLREGETVLVHGGTGVTGRLAVQAARLQGAARVVAAGRNPASLARLAELGADVTIQLDQPDADLAAAYADAAGDGYDVVVDYLWGRPTERLIASMTRADLGSAGKRTRLVQVGEMAGSDLTLPAAALRSSGLEILGNGTGLLPAPEVMRAAFEEVLGGAAAGRLTVDTETVPLADVADSWHRDAHGTRLVLVP